MTNNKNADSETPAFEDCFADLIALDLEGHQSKSQRLFAACCRCVVWDLDETESLRCLGKYNNRRSFGLMLDDDSVRRRLRDAEAKVQRGSRLPAQPLAVIPIADLVANHLELRRPVIHGLLRAGETMNVIASPKVGKSWLVTDLALSVATGRDWLEAFKCETGDVLIIDNELHSETTANRIPKVMNDRGIELTDVDGRVFVANVRGRLQDINRLASDLMKLEPGRYRLVVLDAFYRFLPAKTDESKRSRWRRRSTKKPCRRSSSVAGEIAAIRKRANQARMDLRQTCEDRELVAEYDEVIEQLNEAQHELARLDEEITKRKSWASQDREKAKATPFRQEASRYTSQVEEHERIQADLEAKFEPAQNAVNALQERLAEIEDRLLEP